MAHNDYLMPSLRRLLIDHARLGKIFYRHPTTDDMQRDLELACDQHDQIVDAIQRRDPDAAAEIVRAHFELSRRRMAEYAAPAGVEVALVYEG